MFFVFYFYKIVLFFNQSANSINMNNNLRAGIVRAGKLQKS